LKTDKSKGHDVLFEDQELHWPELVGDHVVVKRMSHLTNFKAEDLIHGKFMIGSRAHYYPAWADLTKDLLSICGTAVTIASRANYPFKKGKPPTKAAVKKLAQEPLGRCFTFDKTQALIQDSNYMVCCDPLKFVSSYLKVKQQDLANGILVRQTSIGSSTGFLAELDKLVHFQIPLLKKFRQIWQVGPQQHPPFQVKRFHKEKFSYQTQQAAIMGMYVHIMFNVRLHGCQHWSTMAMEHRKDLLVMIPYHGQKERVLLREFCFVTKLFWYVTTAS